jgi:hypothetical protein
LERDNIFDTDDGRIAWHPAFFDAIRLELDDYKDVLEFFPEFQLSDEPLRIDVLVIKKPKNITIKKNIASIFRAVNIIEYKSPDDYTAVEDFYKVYAYACLYIAQKKTPVTDLTITFVGSRQPRELIRHFEEVRGYKLEKRAAGVYTVVGDKIPIQVIDSRELSGDEDLWLKSLDNALSVAEARRIITEIDQRNKAVEAKAYVGVVYNVNLDVMEEVSNMSDMAMAVDRTLKPIGILRRTALEAEERRAEKIAQNALAEGASIEFVQKITGLDTQTVRQLSGR